MKVDKHWIINLFKPFGENPKIQGAIKFNRQTNFAFFSMEPSDVKKLFCVPLQEINNAIGEK